MFNKPKDPKPPAKLTPEAAAAPPAAAPATSDADANAADAQKWIDEWKGSSGADVDACRLRRRSGSMSGREAQVKWIEDDENLPSSKHLLRAH